MINIGVTSPNERRLQLLTLLASMPEEAFLWLVVALQPPGLPPHASPWPDGLGGFTPESRAAIDGVQAAAAAYLDPRKEP